MVVLAGSANIPGNINIDNGDWTLASGGALTVNNITGLLGSLNFDGGTLNLTGTNNLHLYGIRVGKDGVGSFTLLSGKSFTADVFLTIGRDSGGQGTFTNQSTVIASTNLVRGRQSRLLRLLRATIRRSARPASPMQLMSAMKAAAPECSKSTVEHISHPISFRVTTARAHSPYPAAL